MKKIKIAFVNSLLISENEINVNKIVRLKRIIEVLLKSLKKR